MTYVWSLGYTKLTDEQLRTVRDVLSGLDTCVSLPTGYGKSLCYAILPWAFDELRNTKKASIVLVVSPLVSLTTDQVRAYTLFCVLTCYFSYVYTTHTKRHTHNTERRARARARTINTHTHTHTHTHKRDHTHRLHTMEPARIKVSKENDIQTDVD